MKIPQYESSVDIKPGNSPEMGLQSVNASRREQAGLTNAIEGVEDAIIKARDFRQQAEAHAYAFQALNEQQALADQDIDFDPAKYETAIDQIGTEAAKSITGKLAKEGFMFQFQRQATAAKFGIRDLFRHKELEASKAAIEYNRQQIVNSFASMDHAGQITAVKTFKDMLMSGIKSGIYTKGEAQAIDAKFQEDVQKSVVDAHIVADPATALTGLKEGKDGPYPGISDQFRAEAIEKAQAYAKKYKREAEIAQEKAINDNEDSLIMRLLDPNKPDPTEGEVVDMMNNGGIRPEFAKQITSALRVAKKEPKGEKSPASFNKMADFILNPENRPEDIRLELLKENARGALPQDEFNTLYTFNQAVNNDTIDKTLPKKSFMQAITIWSDEYANARPEVKARMFKNYMSKVVAGTDPAIAVDEVIRKETLINHPQAANYPKDGKKVIDIMGVIKRIFPTGEIGDEE